MDVLDVDKLALFIGFVMPGFIAIKTYDLFHPEDSIEPTKFVTEALTYSCINYAFCGLPLLFLFNHGLLTENHPWIVAASALFTLAICPVVMALLTEKIRQFKCIQKNIPHPVKKPWDFVFKQGLYYWVIVTFEDNTVVAGKYAKKSFTSSYPTPEQIYLEECWKMNDDGGFERARNGTAGMIIVSSQIKTIELFKFDGEANER